MIGDVIDTFRKTKPVVNQSLFEEVNKKSPGLIRKVDMCIMSFQVTSVCCPICLRSLHSKQREDEQVLAKKSQF